MASKEEIEKIESKARTLDLLIKLKATHGKKIKGLSKYLDRIIGRIQKSLDKETAAL